VWLWFKSPQDEFAAGMMRTFEPPHWQLFFIGKIKSRPLRGIGEDVGALWR
jgi:hypothetical protein